MKMHSPLFGKHSQSKHLYTMARVNLRKLIESLNKPEFYHHTAHDLGVMNGLLLAEGILIGKQPKDVPLVPPPENGKWGINEKKEEEIENARKCNSNDKCEGSDSDNCGTGSPVVYHKESCDSVEGQHSSDANRSPSECGSEEDSKKES